MVRLHLPYKDNKSHKKYYKYKYSNKKSLVYKINISFRLGFESIIFVNTVIFG